MFESVKSGRHETTVWCQNHETDLCLICILRCSNWNGRLIIIFAILHCQQLVFVPSNVSFLTEMYVLHFCFKIFEYSFFSRCPLSFWDDFDVYLCIRQNIRLWHILLKQPVSECIKKRRPIFSCIKKKHPKIEKSKRLGITNHLKYKRGQKSNFPFKRCANRTKMKWKSNLNISGIFFSSKGVKLVSDDDSRCTDTWNVQQEEQCIFG